MQNKSASVLTLAVVSAIAGYSQIPLNPTPSRVVGHARLAISSVSPNLVEGREFYSPQGIALDTSASPPILYVADTGNHRVLAWKNAAQFTSGQPADLVIGQKDKVSTLPQGPGVSAGSFSTGLNSPTGLTVRNKALYVADSGNNRVLRFPAPFEQTEIFPDLVIGQPNFNSRAPNYTGQVSAKGIALAGASGVLRASLAFDTNAQRAGDLWVSDPGNRRVLRFPGIDRAQGLGGFEADLEIGQLDFISNSLRLDITVPASRLIKDRFAIPSVVAFDPQGNLYVTDSDSAQPGLFSRVMVFRPPFSSGMAATRLLGVVPPQPAGAEPIPQPTIDRTAMVGPEGIFFLPGTAGIGVLDSFSDRILIFDVLNQWPAETETSVSPLAKAVVGHTDYSNRDANNGEAAPSGSTFSVPVAAVMNPAGTELYVVDSGNHRVLALPYSGGTFSGATRVLGQDKLDASAPNLIEGREFQFVAQTSRGNVADAALAIDTASDPPHLYVADPYNHRILGFRDLRKVRPGDKADLVIGQPDLGSSMCNYPSNDIDKPTQSSLCRPIGLALDNDGNLYVADSANGRVLRFPNPFARQGVLPQADLVLGQSNFNTRITDPTSRTMATPYGLAFAGDNGLVVSDNTHNRVLFFPKVNGQFTNGQAATKVIGQPNFSSVDAGNSDNRLNGPRLVATDTDARTHIADTGNNRVLIYDLILNVPAQDGRAATILGSLSSPRGVYVSPRTGEIWVTNTNSGSALRFSRYDQLQLNPLPTLTIASPLSTLAIAQDQYGDLFVADSGNRVAIYYPGLTALNGANFLVSRPVLAPGMVSTIKPIGVNQGQQFTSETASYADLPRPVPLPRDLGDVQVLVNDAPAPLYYVSPGQINFQMPMSAPSTGTVDVTVVRRSTGQIVGTSPVAMDAAAPGIFYSGEGPIRRAAVINQDGSINTPTNGAARGSIISIYATGQGVVANAPADGEPASGQTPTLERPRVIISTCYTDDCGETEETLLYSGLAPQLVGVWQINVKVPMRTAPDPQVPIALVFKSIPATNPAEYRLVFTVKGP